MRRSPKVLSGVLLLALLPALGGCYHATVNTGMTPGSQMISQPWATSLIYGLVPPSTVEASSQCRNGVARVETQISFLNYVASAVTLGIYSPMTITVTCASGGMGQDEGLDMLLTREDVEEALEKGESFLIPTR